MTFRPVPVLILSCALLAACDSADQPPPAVNPDTLAREYLFLELAMAEHDPAHVDAYFGPESLASEAAEAQLSLDDIAARVATLRDELAELRQAATDDRLETRLDGLLARLKATSARIDLLRGQQYSFDQESAALFGTRAPDYDASHFEAILDDIDALLPGDEPLAVRVENFRGRFVILPQRLADVFDAAIAECRKRTLASIDLPRNESFDLEYVTDKPWSGYNWYQGNAKSLIQINTELPIFISRAVDLGCHEGYPGHHSYNALLEKNLVDELGWIEFSLYPLFSPQSLIAEGSGNYGIELAFPGDTRIQFEKDVLFPLAGLDASEADRYYELAALLAQLDYAGNEAARDYLNGDITREQAIDWLVRYTLSSPERARQRTEFFDTYRSYVINYNLGKDMVKRYVETGTSTPQERWQKFQQMLSSPVLPADLSVGSGTSL